MEDQRAWAIEKTLWIGNPASYPALMDPSCLIVIPAPPHILSAEEALRGMAQAPRWSGVEFSDTRVERPKKGLIVLAYSVQANRADNADYRAYCTSTWQRKGHEDWRLVQHQQTPQANG